MFLWQTGGCTLPVTQCMLGFTSALCDPAKWFWKYMDTCINWNFLNLNKGGHHIKTWGIFQFQPHYSLPSVNWPELNKYLKCLEELPLRPIFAICPQIRGMFAHLVQFRATAWNPYYIYRAPFKIHVTKCFTKATKGNIQVMNHQV